MPHQIIWSWYTGRWWVSCYVWYSKQGTRRGCSPLRPILAVPNVTAHPSTVSVPIVVLLYCPVLIVIMLLVDRFQVNSHFQSNTQFYLPFQHVLALRDGSEQRVMLFCYTGDTSARKHLRVGDVILSANGKQLSELTHYEAWNYLKEIPDRVIHLVIARIWNNDSSSHHSSSISISNYFCQFLSRVFISIRRQDISTKCRLTDCNLYYLLAYTIVHTHIVKAFSEYSKYTTSVFSVTALYSCGFI